MADSSADAEERSSRGERRSIYGRPGGTPVMLDDAAFASLAAKRLEKSAAKRVLLLTGPLSFGKGRSAIRRRGARLGASLPAALVERAWTGRS